MPNPLLRVVPTEEPRHSPALARVALVNMPFAVADRPSIQCGLLKAELIQAGHQVDVHYLNLELAGVVGGALYEKLTFLPKNLLLGEWLFAALAFGPPPDEDGQMAEVREICEAREIDFEELHRVRTEVLPPWIEHWTHEVDWGQYDAVGFTSTFEQNTAAFSLARAVKEAFPTVKTLFGGANFDGEMGPEYVRALPFIDYAVIGEGDVALPRIIDRIAGGESALGIPGVVGRSGDEVVAEPAAAPIHDMDALPDPDYDDYFAALFRLGRSRVLGSRMPTLPFEAARGCWWGQKQHCTFCGLNRNGIGFRSKSADEAAEQLRRLSSRYKISNFLAVDNILDHRYLEELCEPLAQERNDYQIFYEVKANLRRDQISTLARAGVRIIQPGIESLSSHVLKLMRKGISMLRNVRLLKWAHYYGIDVHWGILAGFPGETSEDYEEQARVAALLSHLPPPKGVMRIWLERFSPYFSESHFPVSDVRPLSVYRYVYPEEHVRLDKIAYFFDYQMDATISESELGDLRQVIDGWLAGWQRRPRPSLTYRRTPDWIQILDRRGEKAQASAFEGVAAAAYEHCGETDRTADAVRAHLENERGEKLTVDEVRRLLHDFCDRGLMLEEKDRFLSLALPSNRHW